MDAPGRRRRPRNQFSPARCVTMATETVHTPEAATRSREERDLPWNVVVLTDPVNLMQ